MKLHNLNAGEIVSNGANEILCICFLAGAQECEWMYVNHNS